MIALLAALSPAVLLAANSVDLLWQGSGYVPPFYEGRSLWGRQSVITFTAIPHIFNSSGRELPAGSLIYRWSKDGTILGNVSGVGVNTLSVPDSVLGIPAEIHVDIMTDEDTVAASDGLALSAIAPSVLVYENNPLLGYLFNHESSQNIVMTSQEIALSAFPLFFSTATKNTSRINYSWTSAGATAQTGENVVYRTADNASGSISIHISADAPSILTQSADKNFLVQLKNNDTAN